MTNATSTGWEGILAEDETIQWQGRPGGGVVWRDLLHFQTFFGLFFLAFSVAWTWGALWMQGQMPSGMVGGFGVVFPLFGSLFIAVGLYMVIGRLFWDAYVRARTWYTLTNQAAYIATDLFGKRSLKRTEFAQMQDPVLIDTAPGDVIFAQERRQYTSSSRSGSEGQFRRSRTHTYYVPVGFRRIDDARAVYRRIVDNRRQDPSEETS